MLPLPCGLGDWALGEADGLELALDGGAVVVGGLVVEGGAVVEGRPLVVGRVGGPDVAGCDVELADELGAGSVLVPLCCGPECRGMVLSTGTGAFE